MRLAKHALHFATVMTLLVSLSFDYGSCASAQQSAPAGIVGRWRSLETSKGGIGSVYEFRSDGTVDFSSGAVVEMQWRIENDQLVLSPPEAGGAEQKQTLKWLGDNKLTLATQAGVTELARVGDRGDADNPIIGEWIEGREMAGHKLEARWLVYPGGKLLFVMPFAIQRGSYTVSDAVLHLKVPSLNPEFRFRLTDRFLTLSKPEDDREDHYARY
jgi:hypothetical protein